MTRTNNLEEVLRSQGQYEEFEERHRETLEQREAVSTPFCHVGEIER